MVSTFDFAVVGGGASGIAISEILSRSGASVVLIESREKLASETTKVFHEWFHTGALYSLAPDSNFQTLRFLLGAVDDLIEYYSFFSLNNIRGTTSGLDVCGKGWFFDQKMVYKYRLRNFNLPWMATISKSVNAIDKIKNHDWLRKRIGGDFFNFDNHIRHYTNRLAEIYRTNSEFYSLASPDLSFDSRTMLRDFIAASISRGVKVHTKFLVEEIVDNGKTVIVKSKSSSVHAKKVLIAAPELLAKMFNLQIKKSFAPMFVAGGADYCENFVELDFYTKKCINFIRKTKDVGVAGGISVPIRSETDDYLRFMVDQHKKRNPRLEVLKSYVGVKNEIIFNKQKRNYLYHIDLLGPKVYSVVLGKYSLLFSMAPEIYRRVFSANPPKFMVDSVSLKQQEEATSLLSPTSWQEVLEESKWV